MKIPKHIIDKMHKANKLISDGNSLIFEVQQYFEKKGASTEMLERIGSELDVPHNDVTEKLIEEILDDLGKKNETQEIH